LRSYLKAYAQGGPLWVLRLVTQGPEADAEAALADLLEREAQLLGITDLEALNMSSVIGPMERLAFLRLLHQAQVVALLDHWQTALEALALGKTLLLPTDHPAQAWAAPGQVLSWSPEVEIPWAEALAQAPQIPVLPEPAQVLERLSTALQGWIRTADLPARRERHRLLAAQTAQARQGRKQKYSMFHADYNPEEMAARRKWHQRYADPFAQALGDVVDIGCGSGIFLELLRDLRVPAFGIDPDPDMVAVCQELGLQALPGDERLLTSFAADSLGGIHASHVIEHIDGERALSFIEHALRVLMPGGLLIIRTPNWRNQTVRHEGFWLDITHVRPYPLPLLKQVMEDAGFEIAAQGFEEFGWNDTYIFGRKPR
jgi:SAM-dependent methyltransferase